MKKTSNLKKRLAKLRAEPEHPVEVILQLDAKMNHALKQIASQEQLTVETFIVSVLSNHLETNADSETRHNS